MQQSFLPIAERELRAAVRHKSTSRLRWWAALLAIVASIIGLFSVPASALPARLVASLFTLQTACAFGLALLAGPFLTADCLSEEKRDGTMNLLFLSGLKARDIVLGKFAGLSLNAVYGLLALLPITAVPILLGGVALEEFCRMALALVNTLFFSLALGLGVSAWVTNYSRGLAGTLVLLAFFGAGLPALDSLASTTTQPGPWWRLAWCSPFCPFWRAHDTIYRLAPSQFWAALMASHLTGWIWLAFACAGLRRSWIMSALGPDSPARRLSAAGRDTRRNRPPASADEPFDPVLRLVGDPPLFRFAVWLIVVAWGALLCGGRLWPRHALPDLQAATVCAFLLKALVAFQACRFFVEARRNGALELLLCTPLRNADLLRAQWRALIRIFFWPVAVFLLLCWIAVASSPSPAPAAFLAPTPGALPGGRSGPLGALFLTIGLAADVAAIGWFGMWLALTVRKPGVAPALTILAVLILPAMLSRFDLVADMLFISWGTTRFRGEFRWLAAARLPNPNEPPPSPCGVLMPQ